jgi:Uma2 family endonuclease
MVTDLSTKFTRTDYEKLPEGLRAELIDGELCKEPSPRFGHQEIAKRILFALSGHVEAWRLQMAPLDVHIDNWNILQPDVLVLAEHGRPAPDEWVEVPPLLVVEVLSPSTAARDRLQKLRIYLGAGVKEVWLVDPGSETIEVWTVGGSRKAGSGERVSSHAVSGFEVDVDELLSI